MEWRWLVLTLALSSRRGDLSFAPLRLRDFAFKPIFHPPLLPLHIHYSKLTIHYSFAALISTRTSIVRSCVPR